MAPSAVVRMLTCPLASQRSIQKLAAVTIAGSRKRSETTLAATTSPTIQISSDNSDVINGWVWTSVQVLLCNGYFLNQKMAWR
jgi:hypothetical protein